MKKYLYIAIAAATLASCSQDEVMDVAEKEAIAFSEGFINNSTRAVDPSKTNSNLTQFNVWGTVKGSTNSTVAIFANDNVQGTAVGEGNVWNCTTKTQYWIAGAVYNFAALVNAGDASNVVLINGLPTSVTYTYNKDNELDLLYARSEENIQGNASGNGPVAFTFDHMLSKVGFKVNNQNSGNTGYAYKVKDIKITSALKTKATVTIGQTESKDNTYTWGSYAGTDLTNLGFGAAVAVDAKEVTDAISIGDGVIAYSNIEHLLIPNTYATLGVSFTLETYVTDTNGTVQHVNTETINKSATNVTFAPETYYLINIGLKVGKVIDFSVTSVKEWGEADSSVTVQ